MSAAAHRIVLLGRPASGKGTQGQRLIERLAVPITSTGDLLRREHNLGTELGLEADRYTSLGQLVPDEVVTASVSAWLDSTPAAASGFILDGTPRTLGQGIALDGMLAQRNLPLTDAVLLEVTADTVADRVRHRLVCERCGRTFRLGVDVWDASAACPACSGVLERRKDDNADSLTKRMAEYEEKTVPLLPFYESRGLLRRISGEGRVSEVFARVLEALEGRREAALFPPA